MCNILLQCTPHLFLMFFILALLVFFNKIKGTSLRDFCLCSKKIWASGCNTWASG